MTKQTIRLIISDIDGTILDDQHQVDSKLKDIIPLLNREKNPFRPRFCSLSSRHGADCA